jgi:hypothetical protein
MARAPSTSRGNTGVESPDIEMSASRGGPTSEICEAFSNAVADGVRLHVPNSIGILAIGIPTCALASFAHFVLGVSPPATGAVGGAGATVYVVRQLVTGR